MTETTQIPVLEKLGSNIAVLRLGTPNEKVVILTEKRLDAIHKIIKDLTNNPPAGLIIAGNSENMFSAGADINVIQSITEASAGEALATKGQSIFDALENLPCPRVAAISGPCVGGACELALACNFRIISDSSKSSIGLPETKIGILPGFGGTQRLPRLIGLEEASKLILTGKVLKPHLAKKVGLVDKITNYNDLIAEAEKLILNGKKKCCKMGLKNFLMTFFPPLRKYVVKTILSTMFKKTKGHYPAQTAAIHAMEYGLANGKKEGLKNEAKELGRLIVSSECKALTNLFFLTESAKGIGKSATNHVQNLQALVIGAGTMGAGIVGEMARSGISVSLKDTKEDALQRGISMIKKDLSYKKSLTEGNRQKIVSSIQTIISYPETMQEIDFVIEAIFEDLELKKTVLGEVADKISTQAIIASNTSSLSISKIAETLPNPSRVIGMHFFNPVNRMPLVEIIRGKDTSDETVCVIAALTSKLGKFPIVVEDVPGFLVNRVLSPYLNEAAFLLEEGYQIEDIDRAALNFGLPMGPIRLLDEIGLDVAAHVADSMLEGYGKRMAAPKFSHQMVEAKRLGKKNKLGFYNFISKPENPDPEVYKLLNIADKKAADPEHIQQRLVMSLVNEAILCLDEGVAGKTGKDAARQIDLGTVMGTGFPAFRGGLIYYANSLGTTKIVNILQALERKVGERFRPSSSLLSRAERGIGFYE